MTNEADTIRDLRRERAAPGGARERRMRRLAVWLPGAVGVIAAVMILGPMWPRGEISFLLDRNKVAVASQRLRVDAAMYRGLDKDRQPFTITAGSAVQPDAAVSQVAMKDLVARIRLSDGPADLHSAGGIYDYNTEQVAVPGAVKFTAADGYTLTTSKVTIDLGKHAVSGSGGVSGTIPAGTFSADRIMADLGERTVMLDGHARLRMTQSAKLRMP